MTNFNIPGLYEHFDLNMFFLILRNDNREYFYDDVNISSIFGNFPYCIWDGGRNFPYYYQCTKQDILRIKNDYINYSVHPRFVFTNPVLQPEDLDDRYCNLLLDLFKDCDSEVVVNSLLMENYLKKNYPQYNLVSSTTKRITNREKALEEIMNPNYYQVCLDYDLNKDMEFLESIPMEYRHKVEFLCNAICPSNCSFRKKHYDLTGRAHLSYLRDGYTVNPQCKIAAGINCRLGEGNNLSREDIEKYSKMGFRYFKLEGRTLPSGAMFANYLYYMIKPEYHPAVMEMACNYEGIFFNDRNSGIKYSEVQHLNPYPLQFKEQF